MDYHDLFLGNPHGNNRISIRPEATSWSITCIWGLFKQLAAAFERERDVYHAFTPNISLGSIEIYYSVACHTWTIFGVPERSGGCFINLTDDEVIQLLIQWKESEINVRQKESA